MKTVYVKPEISMVRYMDELMEFTTSVPTGYSETTPPAGAKGWNGFDDFGSDDDTSGDLCYDPTWADLQEELNKMIY